MVGVSTKALPTGSELAPVDPRIRARRIGIRRGAGRRRLQRMVDLAVVLLVAALFGGALWTPLLDVDEVRVTGAVHLSPAEVREVARIPVGDPLVRVDLGAVGRRVATLPWVAEVVVDRSLGGVITLRVSERDPVATVAGPEGAVFLDRAGRVLGLAGQALPDAPLVEVTGIEAVPAPGNYVGAGVRDVLEVAAHLADAAPGALTSLAVEGLTGTLSGGGDVRFGDAAKLDDKIRSLHTFLLQVDLRCLRTLDLRFPANPVLTRTDGCS